MIFAGEDVADELLAVVDQGRRVAASILKRRGAAVIFAGEDVAGVVVRPAFGARVPGCRGQNAVLRSVYEAIYVTKPLQWRGEECGQACFKPGCRTRVRRGGTLGAG